MTSTEPSSRNLYDLIWGIRRETPEWSRGRFEKLNDLIGTLDVRGKRVLDVCCGMGSKAYAALELGALVWAYDGSVEGPNLLRKNVENQTARPERIKGWRRYKLFTPDVNNLMIVSGMDITNIKNHFKDEKFDIVYMGWALQHVEDPDRAIADLQMLAKPGGIIAASYYNEGYTSQLTLDIRAYTFGLPLDDVGEVMAKIGRRWGYEKTMSLGELLAKPGDNRTLVALNKLIDDKKYTVDEIENTINMEDMLTPYLHNLSDDHVAKQFETHSKVIYRRPGLVRARRL
ncbi:MAG: methyltransferase domain-containing protein [Anaerolineales bacterium]